MGILSDSILGQPSTEPPPADSSNPNAGLSKEILGTDDPGPLAASIRIGSQMPPEQAAASLKLQNQTGLPQDMVSRNPDQVKRGIAANQIDPVKYQKDYPVTSSWLSENPLHAAISSLDFAHLGHQEDLLNNLATNAIQGFKDIGYSYIGLKAFMGSATDKDRADQTDYEKSQANMPVYGQPGSVEKVADKMVRGAPLMGTSFLASLGLGAAGTVGGAAATAPEGGVGAVPGGGTAAMVGGAIPFALSETGSSYLAFEKLRDKNGNPIDQNVARGAAALSGVINGALMMVPQKMLLSKIPGIDSLTRSGLQEMLQSPTMSAAMNKYLAGIGEQAAAMGSLNFMQTMVRSAGGDLAKMVSDGSIHTMTPTAILSSVFSPEKLKSAAATIPEGLAVGAGFGGTFGSLEYMSNIQRVEEAQSNAKAYGDLGKNLSEMKMLEHSPEKTQEVIQRLAENGPVRYVYQPMDTFNQYWQDKGINPRDVAQKIFGSHDAYDEASRTGADLQIPIERYATTIAPSEHNQFFQNEIRSNPTSMNGREAGEYLKSKMAEADQQANATPGAEAESTDATQKIYQDMTQKLKAVGFTGPEAENQAQLYRKYFGTMALRSGEDPFELYQKNAPEITRGPGEPLQETAQTMFQMKPEEYQRILSEQRQLEGLKAAVRDPETGEIFTGESHIEAAESAPDGDLGFRVMKEWNDGTDNVGFLDYEGKFISRTEAEKQYQVGNIEDILQKKKFFFQGGDEHLGSIQFGGEKVGINLLKDANLSTFLHETGHLFLKAFGDLAGKEGAAPDLKEDYAKALDFLGVKEGGQIEREHHEKWARSFESYLMEGKAPSADLRSPFARFRDWLVGVYSNIQKLGVELTPEVRGVFDRLLASKNEVAAAENQQGMTPLFADPKSIGMSDEESDKYLKAVAQAKQSAEDEMSTKLLKDFQRDMSEERESVRGLIEKEVNQKKEYIAQSVLTKGTLPDGSGLPEGMQPFKLSRDAVKADFPDYDPKTLPRGIFGADGVHPDQAAELFGFKSGSELLFNLQTAPDRKQLIEQMTDEKMKEMHGNLMDVSNLADMAQKAVHNEDRSKVLRKELEYLASDNLAAFKGLVRRVTRPIPTIEEVRRQAEDLIDNKLVREIVPGTYQRAESVASREAVEHLLRGDLDSSFEAKQRELLNHELYRAAAAARDDIQSRLGDVARFSKDSIRAKIGKAGSDYLERIDDILDRFDFRKASLKELDSRQNLKEFVADREREGYDVSIPDSVMDEANRQHYKDMKYGDLSDVFDSLETIKHLAYLKTELLANKKGRDFEEVKASAIASIQENHSPDLTGEKPNFAPTMKDKILKGMDGLAAEHTKMEFLARLMDGGKYHGPFWEAIFQPFNDAADAEAVRRRESIQTMRGIFDRYSVGERAKFYSQRFHIPEIDNTMTKISMLSTVLNWGTEGNRAALLDGYGWKEDQVRAIWKNLDRRDFETAQAILDHVNSFWGDASAVQRRQSGLVPEKIPAAPFDVKLADGSVVNMKGGYYPLAYNREAVKGLDVNTEESVNDLFGGQVGSRAMTAHSFMKERVGSGGLPVRLEMNVLTKHLSDVIHDITHREAVIDAHKLINDPDIKANVQAAAGTELYKQLNPWLKRIAGDTQVQPMSKIEGLIGGLRSNITLAEMGANVTSALIHTSSYLMAARELGPEYSVRGLNDVWGKPTQLGKNWDFISSRSEFMKDRALNFDRDIRDMGKNLNITGVDPGILGQIKAYSPLKQSALFSHFVGMDLAVAMPTWLGAYNKAMDGKMENIAPGDEKSAIEFADNLVRDTKGSGAAKDLAAIQSGSNGLKLFTMFYSQMSIIGNQFMEAHREFKMDRDFPKLMATATMSWFAPAVLTQLLRGHTPSDDEGWTKWFAKTEAMYPLEGFILMRDFARFFEGGGKDFQGSPVFNGFTSIGKAIYGAGNRIAGDKDEFEKEDVKNATVATGYLTGLPTRQLWRSADYLHDWITGEEQPETPMEGAWRTVVGKKPGKS